MDVRIEIDEGFDVFRVASRTRDHQRCHAPWERKKKRVSGEIRLEYMECEKDRGKLRMVKSE